MTDDLPFTVTGEGGTLFTTDYTDFHKLSIWIINDLKFTLCYSVPSVVSSF